MRARASIALGFVCVACHWAGSQSRGQDALRWRTREPPANAIVRPGVDTVGYPSVGPRQVAAVARQVAGSTVLAAARCPVDAAGHVLLRASERLAVRLHELGSAIPTRSPGAGPTEASDGRLDGGFGSPLMPARLRLLTSSEASIQELLALIRTATTRIDLMMYGWEDDPTGREVADALARAGARGVTVRLLVDRGAFTLHNPAFARSEQTFLDRLGRVPNVQLILPPDPLLRFDHRKLAVVDGRVAWSGGMILTEVARRRWENLAFVAEGPVVGQYAALFEERWREVGGRPSGPPCSPTVWEVAPTRPNARVRLVRTDSGERTLKDALYHAVDHARHHVYLENPYFSDRLLAEKLVDARRRGVDVRVVVTLRGNVERLNRFVVLTANRLLRGGVRVYLAPGMTHVKALSADGVWSYVGTANFDELSLRNNREVGLAAEGREVARQLEDEVFLPSLARAEELHALLPLPEHLLELLLLEFWF